MNLLSNGALLRTGDGRAVKVMSLLGAGGQGEVYRAELDGQVYALKWYHHPATEWQRRWSSSQREALEGYLLRLAPPDPRFVWPQAVVDEPERRTYGYLMELLPPALQGLERLVLGRMSPPPGLRTLARGAVGMAECFRRLHNAGACYKDINLGGPLLDPRTGAVRICDVDNVRVNRTPGDVMFIYFAAPELIRGEVSCQTSTDLHSLAVLLFYMFVRHHPLDGARELQVNVFNEAAQRRFYGVEPVFIYDPDDDSNRPVQGFHDPALRNWSLYPDFVQRAFIRAFCEGLYRPERRVREGEWMEVFARLEDVAFPCAHCGAELAVERLPAQGTAPCPRCQGRAPLPWRLAFADRFVFLNHDTRLFPHHLGRRLDFDHPVAELSRHPDHPDRWGLRNTSERTWAFQALDGAWRELPPGRTVPLRDGLALRLGDTEAVVRAPG